MVRRWSYIIDKGLSCNEKLLSALRFKSFIKTTKFKRYSLSTSKTVRKSYSSRKFMLTYYPSTLISSGWHVCYLRLRSRVSNSQCLGLLGRSFRYFTHPTFLTKLGVSFNTFRDDGVAYLIAYDNNSNVFNTTRHARSDLNYYEIDIAGVKYRKELMSTTLSPSSFDIVKSYAMGIRRLYIVLLLHSVM